MELNIQDFRNEFYFEIKNILEPEGYIFRKSKYDFVKSDQDWKFCINVYCHKWSTSIEIITQAYVGNTLIDKIRNKAIGEKYHQNFVFGGTVEQLSAFKRGGWKNQFSSILVINNSELSGIVKEWKEQYENYIKDFYKTAENLNFIEAWYDKDEQFGLYVSGFMRALNRPIIMHLLNKPKKKILDICERDIDNLAKFLSNKDLERLKMVQKFIIKN